MHIAELLNEVESDLTDIPYDSEAAMRMGGDGRMYPPLRDNRHVVSSEVARYRVRRHNVFLGANGAIAIRTVGRSPKVVFTKAGADGAHVRDL